MSWAKLDDRFHENRKVRGLWRRQPAALGLHVLALTYCAGHETDGFVDLEFLEDKVPSASGRRKMTAALVEAGMWTQEPEGFLIHDYLDYHPSRTQMDEKRAKDADRKSRGRANGGHASARTPSGQDAESTRTDASVHAESDGPVPTRPVPTTPATQESARGAVRFNGRIVPPDRVTVAEAILADFNRIETTNYKPATSTGKPTEQFKRILGAIVEHPDLELTEAEHVQAVALTAPNRFWGTGPAQPGHVWGPNVTEPNRQKAAASLGAAKSEMEAFREHKRRLADLEGDAA